jgi:hypothetical protein
MTNSIYKSLAALALAVAMTAAAGAQDETKLEPAPLVKPSTAELRDKQLDVSLEARDIERVLGKLKRASELSKTRIGEAAKAAESASTALDRGDSADARQDAKQAAEMFREIAKQLEALLAEETPQRIAAARNLANQLAMTERQFAQQFQGILNPAQSGGKGMVDPKSQVQPGKAKGQRGDGQAKMKDDPSKEPDPKKGQGSKQGPPENKGAAANKDGESTPGRAQNNPKKNGDEENTSGGGKPDPQVEPKDGAGGGQNKDDNDPQEGPGGRGSKAAEEPKDGDGGGTAKDKGKRKNERGGGGAMTQEERREALAGRAEQLAQTGKTLEDILKSISESTDPADKEAVAKVAAILKETDLLKAIEAMQQAADLIRTNKLDDARLAALDIGDRMEITAQRLDAAYRTIVAPQAEELRTLEQQLADLREELDQLQTPSQIAAWHREARELLDKMEQLGISEKVREEFLEEMKKAGLGVDGARNAFKWGLVNDRYVAPAGYGVHLLRVQEEVQARIQTLLLGDITSAADEATPPKYQDLVERYYRVLSGDSGVTKPDVRSSKSETTPKPEGRN